MATALQTDFAKDAQRIAELSYKTSPLRDYARVALKFGRRRVAFAGGAVEFSSGARFYGQDRLVDTVGGQQGWGGRAGAGRAVGWGCPQRHTVACPAGSVSIELLPGPAGIAVVGAVSGRERAGRDGSIEDAEGLLGPADTGKRDAVYPRRVRYQQVLGGVLRGDGPGHWVIMA